MVYRVYYKKPGQRMFRASELLEDVTMAEADAIAVAKGLREGWYTYRLQLIEARR